MIVSDYAIKFRTAVFVFTGVLIVAGAAAYRRLPREGTPDITIPYVFVTASYDGTAPAEVEKLIAIPIEKAVNDVENIKEIRSTSAENLCAIAIEFVAGQDIEQAKQRVKDKIDLARADLPDDLDEPIVDAFNFSSDFPVFIAALSGDPDPARLKHLAEDLQDEIELLSGVRKAEVSGTREREIRVELDLPRLAAYRIPLSSILGRIAAENSTVSAGNIEMAGDKFQVRIPGEFEWAFDLRKIMLAERNGKPVYLSDLAVVTDTFKDRESISRLNGEPSVSLSIKKRSGVNAVGLIREVKTILNRAHLPQNVKLTTVMDQSAYIKSMIEELENNIASGFILVVGVLLLFMGARNSLFVGLAIPLSMLMTFAIMDVIGMTLNMIVLFSLVLGVGMLVDNAIVIVENIYRHHTELGLTRIESARRGTSEVAWPVITSTLTTVVAFLPLIYWPGIMGQFMKFLPETLIFTLSASLFVAMVINPAFCSAFIGARKREAKARDHWFMRGYERMLRGAIHRRVPVLLVGFAFLILSAELYGRYGRGVELFPTVDPRNATIEVKYPQGTSIERVDAVLAGIEKKLTKYSDIKFALTTVGSAGGMIGMGSSGGTHIGNIYVEFVDAAQRKEKSVDLVNRIRDDVGRIAGAEVRVEKEEEGPPTGAPVSIELSGDDFDGLTQYGGEIVRSVETVPGLVDLQDDLEEALPEFRFNVDRHRVALLGMDTDTIGLFLRMSIYGLEASKFRADEDEFDITVRLPTNQRNSFDLLNQILIPTQNGAIVPLSSVGRVEYTGGRGAIKRKDQKRVVTITGNDNGRGVDKILADVKPRVDRLELPKGYTVDYTGDTKEMQESGAFLFRAFMVAVGLILVILVIQFNSVLVPSIIMFTVILSLIGVIWGLLICRMRFGVVMTGVGVISLAGIVVNNAIVLIDCIQLRRREGMNVVEAVVNAGRTRLRPVLLTAGTTVLGLIPMAIGWSVEFHRWPPKFVAGAESSSWWAPMAVAVIFGLTLATVLTLVLVPALYMVTEGISERVRRWFGVAPES